MKDISRLARLLSALAVVALGAAACGGDGGDADGGGADGDDDGGPARLAFFAPVQNGFIQAAIEGAEAGAEEAGGSVETTFAADGDLTRQTNQIQDAIASQNFEGLLVYPLAPEVAPAVEQAIEAGLKVAVVENSMNPENPLESFALPEQVISTTEPLADRVQGLVDMTVSACADLDPCNVAYIRGIQQNPTDVAIFDGYEEGLQRHPEIEIVGSGEGMYQVEPARSAAQDLLRANPEIDVFATNADIMTEGAALAAEAAGRDDIQYIGVGASETGCEAVQAGDWFGTTNSLPRDAGEVAARATVEAIRGGEGPADPLYNPLKESGLPLSSTEANADQCPAQWSI